MCNHEFHGGVYGGDVRDMWRYGGDMVGYGGDLEGYAGYGPKGRRWGAGDGGGNMRGGGSAAPGALWVPSPPHPDISPHSAHISSHSPHIPHTPHLSPYVPPSILVSPINLMLLYDVVLYLVVQLLCLLIRS